MIKRKHVNITLPTDLISSLKEYIEDNPTKTVSGLITEWGRKFFGIRNGENNYLEVREKSSEVQRDFILEQGGFTQAGLIEVLKIIGDERIIECINSKLIK